MLSLKEVAKFYTRKINENIFRVMKKKIRKFCHKNNKRKEKHLKKGKENMKTFLTKKKIEKKFNNNHYLIHVTKH